MRVILGTAQFGLDYGVSNQRGKVDREEVQRILDAAHDHGVRVLDTASAYGDAEILLGSLLGGRFEIVTKFSIAELHGRDIREGVRDRVNLSIKRLRVERLASVLLHDSSFLHGPEAGEVVDELEQLVAAGLIEKIGVSIYEESDMPASIPKAISVVQGPVNLFDWRLCMSEHLIKAETEFHARSVFLQGLLTMKVVDMPDWVTPFAKEFFALENFLRVSGQTAVEACIRHVVSFANVKAIVIGVTTADELSKCLDAFNRGPLRAPSSLATVDMGLIDPRKWPRQ